MTLRSNDLQSDSDLGSIRNSCDVLLSKEQHDQHMRRQFFRIILLFLLLQSIFSKYSGFNIGSVYSTCYGCGLSQKTLSLDQTNWEIGKQNVIVSFEWHHFEMTCLWHALNWPYTQVFTFYGLWSVFISLLQSIYFRGLICIIHNDVERTCPPRALPAGSL